MEPGGGKEPTRRWSFWRRNRLSHVLMDREEPARRGSQGRWSSKRKCGEDDKEDGPASRDEPSCHLPAGRMLVAWPTVLIQTFNSPSVLHPNPWCAWCGQVCTISGSKGQIYSPSEPRPLPRGTLGGRPLCCDINPLFNCLPTARSSGPPPSLMALLLFSVPFILVGSLKETR